MAKMKGLFKGIKYISQIFVFKEHEMEIGYPTDVRHVAHIGWDSGSSVSSPSWMKEFKTSSHFTSSSFCNVEEQREISWASQGLQTSAAEIFSERSCPDVPKAPKKVKRKKPKSSSQHTSTTRSSGKSSKTRSSCAASIGGVDGIPERILVN